MNTVIQKQKLIHAQERHKVCQANRLQSENKQSPIEIQGDQIKRRANKRRRTKAKSMEEKWDERCNQAIQLFNQGEEYPDIAKSIGCHVSNLFRELKKRGLFQMLK
ncbi:hypothetical protein U0X36_04865 [Bacillus thuringiensis]|uniref:hypothetical protein n=1 Tax=Bacillus thuringiensis TaxID=1428 RepID=UPI000E53138F|nr:hypothetical protein [Bacillus thuringiensis]MDZ3952285.1 hypothetical protein [Bacillus thuringiensis]RGP53432.1 hypothetical protein BTW32_09885 [Bacillus thuringiensis]